jgi:hypothetical protein
MTVASVETFPGAAVCHSIEQQNGKPAPLHGLGVAHTVPNSRAFVSIRGC